MSAGDIMTTHLLQMLDIDEMFIPEEYDPWNGMLWSYANDLESMENHLTYVYEMYNEETGEGKEEYDAAVTEYHTKLDTMRDEVKKHLSLSD